MDDVARAEEAPNAKSLWWCLVSGDEVIQHVTDAYSNHAGHLRCVAVGFAEPVSRSALAVLTEGGNK